MTLRVLTWNIKTGGSGGRLDAVLALLRRERPDILALQELRGFPGGRMRDVARALGMTPFLARSVLGQPVAVLVRPPLRMVSWSALWWRLHHAAAVVVTPTAAGPVTVVSTHLNPFSPSRRSREARRLVARCRAARGPVLIAGDLNSLDPGTDHAERLARLPEHYRRRHLGPDGAADTRAIAEFEAGGLVDLWRVAGEGDGLTVPTTAGGGGEFSAAGMRLDYLLGTASIAAAATRVRVIRGDEAEYASDHYPVVVELAL
ncbi:endonuclease/exonuclease/phosphatase family protein [Actinoplanes sp. NPDC049668]|uniref:endonuclease/exonuclease/phosphatase family protein n=1 Tax=unclassified Actinoplanes TaxID=2626549 RepID=UPI0033ABF2F6